MSRVAIISSPRSGNTWTRFLLRDACGLEERAQNNPWDVDWDALPDRCVLQMHCHRTDAVVGQLRDHGFGVLTMARHPLDVLLSILQCSESVPETAQWVDGEGGDEEEIRGRTPQDHAFGRYARSERARVLLSISPQWWDTGDEVRLRYEDLTADPVAALQAAIAALGLEPTADVATVVDANRIDRLQVFSTTFFWRGTAGHWRGVLTAGQATEIRRTHQAVFDALGYAAEPDPLLTPRLARENWDGLFSDG